MESRCIIHRKFERTHASLPKPGDSLVNIRLADVGKSKNKLKEVGSSTCEMWPSGGR